MKAEITKIVLKLKDREIEVSLAEAEALMAELQRVLQPVVKEIIREVPYIPFIQQPAPIIVQPSPPPFSPPWITWCGSDGQATWGGQFQVI